MLKNLFYSIQSQSETSDIMCNCRNISDLSEQDYLSFMKEMDDIKIKQIESEIQKGIKCHIPISDYKNGTYHESLHDSMSNFMMNNPEQNKKVIVIGVTGIGKESVSVAEAIAA